MDEVSVKGDLKNSNAPIIKVKIREHSGMPVYKAEFRTNDERSLVKHFNILKDKFGINCFDLKREFQDNSDVEKEKAHLDDWREKSKGLREDPEFSRKMKEAFSK